MHLLRAAMRFVSYAGRKKVAAALRPIYTAPTDEIARAESALGKKYPAGSRPGRTPGSGAFRSWRSHPNSARSSTPRTIESLNYQLRKVIKNRGHFPSDGAAIKLLWLAIRDIEDKRARQRSKEKGLPADRRKAPGDSSKAPSSKAGNKPSARSPWPIPSASSPT